MRLRDTLRLSNDPVIRANEHKTILLLTLLSAAILLAGRLLAGWPGMLGAVLLALALVATTCWLSETLVLRLATAHEVEPAEQPELHALVGTLARRIGLPVPRLYLIEEPAPNAFAVGRDPRHAAIALTSGLLDLLDDAEGAAVLAHELGHVARRDTLPGGVLAVVVFALTLPLQLVLAGVQWIVDAAQGYSGGRGSEDPGFTRRRLMVYLCPLIAPVIRLLIPRRCEYEADEVAVQLAANPQPVASALQKMRDAIPLGPPVDADPAMHHLFVVDPTPDWELRWLFQTRPPLQERVQRLRHKLTA